MEKQDVDHILNLRRFLYVCSEENRYIAGDPFAHNYFQEDKTKSLKELKNADLVSDINSVLAKASMDMYLPQKPPLIFALAYCCAQRDKVKLQTEAYKLVVKTCKTIEELLLFVKFYTKLSEHKGFGSGFKRCINNWYLNLKPMEFTEIVTKYRGRHGWTHKNIFEMTRPKTDNVQKAAVLKYVMRGLKGLEEQYGNDEQIRSIINHIKEVESFKHCEDPKELAKLIKKHKYTIEFLPAHFIKYSELWEAEVPLLPIRDLLTALPRLQNYGLLKHQSPLVNIITEALYDNNRIAESGIHPVEVLILLHNYTNGGKCPDFKKIEYLKSREASQVTTKDAATSTTDGENSNPAPAPPPPPPVDPKPKYKANNNVINAFYKVLSNSFKNVKPTNQRYMVTVDAREHMKEEKCFKCGNVTALKAAVMMALYIVKSEREVHVAVFNDKGVATVNIDKNMTMNQAEQKLLEAENGHVQFQKPFEWAQFKKKKIDVFINIFHSPKIYIMLPKELRQSATNIRGALDNYRKKMKQPHCKVISLCLCKHNYGSSLHMVPGMLDICGFDENVPKIIEAFTRDSFK